MRLGLSYRAMRRKRGWGQAELAARARSSQASVSRIERGQATDLTLRTLARVADALGARVSLRLLFGGEALDRLLDAVHAGIVDDVVALLLREGWQTVAEATFSVYGERGSIDVLAFHPPTGSLLVIEVKSALPDMQALLAGVDRKVRLAPGVARDRGWEPSSVSTLLVFPEDRTVRRRLVEHAVTFDRAFPSRNVAVRRWLRAPAGRLAGVLFLTPSQSTAGRHRIRGPRGPKRPDPVRIPDR